MKHQSPWKPIVSTSTLDQLGRTDSARHSVLASHGSITHNCQFKIMAQRSFSKLLMDHLGGRMWQLLEITPSGIGVGRVRSPKPTQGGWLQACPIRPPQNAVGTAGGGSRAGGTGTSLLHLAWPRAGWNP